MQSLKKLTFVTGNKNKLAEVQQILGQLVTVESVSADLPELQGEPEDIAKEKAKYALKTVPTPFITEDTSLCFNSLKGLPGPYIKWFLDKLGHEGLNKLIVGFEDKTAYAQCIFAYQESPEAEPILFIGKCPGKIVAARGDHNFGWDPIFEPEGFNQTFAEMDKDIKNTISHRGKALQEMVKYFESKKQDEPKKQE